MHHVLSFVAAGDEDIIYVDESESKILEDSVHKSLKGLRCIFEAERDTQEFPQTERGDDSCLRNILRVNRDLMIATDQVYL